MPDTRFKLKKMLLITVPSNGVSKLTFSTFEQYDLPAPLYGAQSEINGTLVLNFEDEADALIYLEQLENLSLGLDDKSSEANLAIGDMITAIRNDEFVQGYAK